MFTLKFSETTKVACFFLETCLTAGFFRSQNVRQTLQIKTNDHSEKLRKKETTNPALQPVPKVRLSIVRRRRNRAESIKNNTTRFHQTPHHHLRTSNMLLRGFRTSFIRNSWRQFDPHSLFNLAMPKLNSKNKSVCSLANSFDKTPGRR